LLLNNQILIQTLESVIPRFLTLACKGCEIETYYLRALLQRIQAVYKGILIVAAHRRVICFASEIIRIQKAPSIWQVYLQNSLQQIDLKARGSFGASPPRFA